MTRLCSPRFGEIASSPSEQSRGPWREQSHAHSRRRFAHSSSPCFTVGKEANPPMFWSAILPHRRCISQEVVHRARTTSLDQSNPDLFTMGRALLRDEVG